jgi:hypothetical protein
VDFEQATDADEAVAQMNGASRLSASASDLLSQFLFLPPGDTHCSYIWPRWYVPGNDLLPGVCLLALATQVALISDAHYPYGRCIARSTVCTHLQRSTAGVSRKLDRDETEVADLTAAAEVEVGTAGAAIVTVAAMATATAVDTVIVEAMVTEGEVEEVDMATVGEVDMATAAAMATAGAVGAMETVAMAVVVAADATKTAAAIAMATLVATDTHPLGMTTTDGESPGPPFLFHVLLMSKQD